MSLGALAPDLVHGVPSGSAEFWRGKLDSNPDLALHADLHDARVNVAGGAGGASHPACVPRHLFANST
jgi:hypothetical protein